MVMAVAAITQGFAVEAQIDQRQAPAGRRLGAGHEDHVAGEVVAEELGAV